MAAGTRSPSVIAARRLQSELKEWVTSPPEGCCLERVPDDTLLTEWIILMQGPETPPRLYDGEVFRLRVRFDERYPIEAPEVTFIPPAPVHPHVFSVGHICADILYTGSGGAYSPALTISKLCLAIRSMLASATVREPPADDEAYSARVRAAGGRSPKKTFWHFHDDKA